MLLNIICILLCVAHLDVVLKWMFISQKYNNFHCIYVIECNITCSTPFEVRETDNRTISISLLNHLILYGHEGLAYEHR